MKEAKKSLLAMALAFALFPAADFVGHTVDRISGGDDIADAAFRLTFVLLAVILIKVFRLRTDSPKPVAIAFGIFAGLGVIIPISLLIAATKYMTGTFDKVFTPLTALQSSMGDGRSSFYAIFLVGILAPISEEVFFRVFLAQQLRRTMSLPLTLILSSIPFALLHGYALQSWSLFGRFMMIDFIPLMFMSVAMGCVYFRYGWIASILAHAVFNLKAYYMDAMLDAIVPFILLIPAGLILLYLLFSPKFHRGTIHDH